MAQPVTTETVTYPYNGSQGSAYLARPQAAGQYPVVIVIQEWWGLDEHIKDVTRRFAGEGFVAIAPDLFHGRVTNEPSEAQKLSMELDQSRAARELDAAAAYGLGQPYAKPGKAGVVGYCMGGGLSLLMACRSDRLGAVAVYYGPPPQNMDEIANIKAPVLGIFGADDDWLMPEVPKLEEAMKRHGKQFDLHVYQGAPHAFFNDTDANSYRKEASEDAWNRTLDLFKKNL